jgi:adenylate kinase family enzyme
VIVVTQYSSKLVILRGNSGSGKSAVAKQLREISQRKIAYVEQDNIRRTILKEKETDDGANITLISQIVEFALQREYDVVLEGILKFKRYGSMLDALIAKCPEHYVYYLDIPFEETLRRHATKPIAKDVSEDLLKNWYLHQDLTRYPEEKIIPEKSTLNETVGLIVKQAGL